MEDLECAQRTGVVLELPAAGGCWGFNSLVLSPFLARVPIVGCLPHVFSTNRFPRRLLRKCRRPGRRQVPIQPPPPLDAPQVFKNVFLQIEIFGENNGAAGAEEIFPGSYGTSGCPLLKTATARAFWPRSFPHCGHTLQPAVHAVACRRSFFERAHVGGPRTIAHPTVLSFFWLLRWEVADNHDRGKGAFHMPSRA